LVGILMGHAILELTGIPNLAEMREATFEELPDSLKIQNALEMRRLPEFGMQWFIHEASKSIWLGLVDPGVHEHDRWFLTVLTEVNQWYSVMLDAQLSGRAIVLGDLRFKTTEANRDYVRNLVARLHHAHSMYNSAALETGRPQIDFPRAAAYSRLLNGVKHTDIAMIGTEFDLRELHELLYHYDEWIVAHPEAAGLPRELVMRMYKLNFYGRYEGMNPVVLS
jgi:hypothetical protein